MGGDCRSAPGLVSSKSFNPRPRMGGDCFRRLTIWYVNVFQSTPPHGGRHWMLEHDVDGALFQSTPPHGGRQDFLRQIKAEFEFQSTPPHGGRHISFYFASFSSLVSIHAPAWGATIVAKVTLSLIDGFNPRPRMGGDYLLARGESCQNRFNPRPRMGGDRL